MTNHWHKDIQIAKQNHLRERKQYNARDKDRDENNRKKNLTNQEIERKGKKNIFYISANQTTT